MKTDIANYLHEYNNTLLGGMESGASFSKLGNTFSRSSAGELAAGLKPNIVNKEVNLPWLDELDLVTEKIMAIASNPRTHVRFDKEIRLAEQAVKVDGTDMRMTTKNSKLWKLQGEDFKPEKVYTVVYEADYAIYENRFLLNLVNKINNFLNKGISELSDLTKLINKNYVDRKITLASIDDINKIGNMGKITYPAVKNDENVLLTTSDAPFLSSWSKLISAKNRINNFYSTPFYKYLKDQKPLSDSDVHITNILADDKTYAPCYNFYLKLLTMINEKTDVRTLVDPAEYHNFVITNLFSVLKNEGFTHVSKEDEMKVVKGLITLDKYKVTKDDMYLYITTDSKDHIDLKFEFNYKKTIFNIKDPLFVGKRSSLVSLDLIPSKSEEFLNVEELAVHFRKIINKRLKKDYTNAFIITPIDGTQKDDVIICSPHVYKIDANITNMIRSCLIFAEGDVTLYSKLCPVCGAYMDGEQENGNCYCSNCGSVYSLMSQGKEAEKVQLIWVKRIKNPD